MIAPSDFEIKIIEVSDFGAQPVGIMSFLEPVGIEHFNAGWFQEAGRPRQLR